MKFKLAVLVLVAAGLLSTSLSAQTPESTTQMSLAKSQVFVTRLQYLMGQQARTVLAESLATACHQARVVYAQQVISNTHQMAQHAAPIMVGGVNLIGTVVPNQGGDTVDSSATDAAILSQVATFWTALARCETGS